MSKKNKIPESIETSRSSKQERLFQNFLKTVQQFMSGKVYVPLSQSELIERLRLPPQHISLFKEVLDTLTRHGTIEFASEKYSLKEAAQNVVCGVLHVHPRGFGFLQVDDQIKYPVDIFIPKHLTQNAVDGDRVEVVINTEVVSDKGPEGKVVTILSRGRTHIAGIIRGTGRFGELFAYVPLLGLQQRVMVEANPDFSLKIGDRIVMEVLDWGSKETETVCRMSEYIGHISDPSCDIKAAIAEFELRKDFPINAIEEAKKFGKQVSTADIKDREDIRGLECFTIDPDTAKDFDDALTLTKDDQGFFHLGVHIADVSHYVKQGSAIDKEARLRCNSTYFPNYCLPMLPSELSENLCSLRANVNRLTASVFMDFDPEGNLVNYRVARTVIKSAKRFTYKEAKKVLDGEKASVHAPTLRLMTDLCFLLKRKRYERGSIEFSLPELVVMVDENGIPTHTDYISYDITHQMVEEFMLKANEVVATHLTHQGKNLTYRIHEEPAEENLRDFAFLARAFGFKLSDKPSPAEFQTFFTEAGDTPYGQYLATSYIRRMRLAIYSADNLGHYGLGLTHYCHFTSPIRRYVDLVAHRILFGDSDDRVQLELVASDCSEKERISSKAENSVVLLKKLRLLDKMHTENNVREFEAVVTRVKNFGFFFEVLDLMLEGFLHVSELDNDYYVYEEIKMRLRGNRHGQIYAPGNRIKVMLKEVNYITLESKWYLSDFSERPQFERTRSRRQRNERFDRSERYDRSNRSEKSDRSEKERPNKEKTFEKPKKDSKKKPQKVVRKDSKLESKLEMKKEPKKQIPEPKIEKQKVIRKETRKEPKKIPSLPLKKTKSIVAKDEKPIATKIKVKDAKKSTDVKPAKKIVKKEAKAKPKLKVKKEALK